MVRILENNIKYYYWNVFSVFRQSADSWSIWRSNGILWVPRQSRLDTGWKIVSLPILNMLLKSLYNNIRWLHKNLVALDKCCSLVVHFPMFWAGMIFMPVEGGSGWLMEVIQYSCVSFFYLVYFNLLLVSQWKIVSLKLMNTSWLLMFPRKRVTVNWLSCFNRIFCKLHLMEG